MRSTILILLVAAVAALGFFEVNAEPVANPSADPLIAAFANAYPQAGGSTPGRPCSSHIVRAEERGYTGTDGEVRRKRSIVIAIVSCLLFGVSCGVS